MNPPSRSGPTTTVSERPRPLLLVNLKMYDTKEIGVENPPTCGKGLAENSALPAKLGELIASVAENLELHMKALDLKDESSWQEHSAYLELAEEHREIATHLQATARRMAGYRDLPMGRHDQEAMSAPSVLEAFEKFVKCEQELLALLQQRIEQDRKMLLQMGGAGGGSR